MDADSLRSALDDIRVNIEGRDATIAAAVQAGIDKAEIAKRTGLSRQTVYDALTREERRAAEAKAKHPSIEWSLGRVVEDRYGLRWRSDINTRTHAQGWVCRSADLRVWRTDEQMAAREPLTHIRDEVWFTMDPDVRAARAVGHAEDAATTISPDSDRVDEPSIGLAAYRRTLLADIAAAVGLDPDSPDENTPARILAALDDIRGLAGRIDAKAPGATVAT